MLDAWENKLDKDGRVRLCDTPFTLSELPCHLDIVIMYLLAS